jgi:hypothetical protein
VDEDTNVQQSIKDEAKQLDERNGEKFATLLAASIKDVQSSRSAATSDPIRSVNRLSKGRKRKDGKKLKQMEVVAEGSL